MVEERGEVLITKGTCPRCDADITMEEIRQICVLKDANGRDVYQIKDEGMIIAALPYLNKYRKKVGINTCLRKAHFLAQIAAESKFSILQERFTYSNWKRMQSLFKSYFKQFQEGEVRDKEARRLSNAGNDELSQKMVANAVYGNTHPLGNEHIKFDDGWRYSGKGFKQITWKGNYRKIQNYFNENMKIDNEVDIEWLENDNPYKLKNSPKDAIVSALAYWGWKKINQLAIEISDKAVENVTYIINEAKSGLSDRINFFNKAVEVLETKKCSLLKMKKLNERNEKGSIVVIRGKSNKYGMEDSSLRNKKWLVYDVFIYCNLSYDSYVLLKNKNELPDYDYKTELAMNYSGRSVKRYGSANETPPGKYFLNKGLVIQKYHAYLSDTEGEGSAMISGVDGIRTGIAIHGGWPKGAIGCLTTHTSNYGNKARNQPINVLVKELLDNIPDFMNNRDDRPVIVVLEERKADKTNGVWTGIIETN